MIKADVANMRGERAHERYGWMILSANAVLGILAAVVVSAPAISIASTIRFETAYPILMALGTALVGFNALALVVALVPYKRYERWAWFTLWVLPLQWLSQFVLSPDLTYLLLAVLTMLGLLLPYRRFFPGSKQGSL